MISFSKEQIYIVTGASSGLGEATALMLNELGATVVGIARNEERMNALKARCRFPENMHLEIKDLTKEIESLPQYVKTLKEKYGKFSGMAYCAGIGSVVPLQATELEQMENTFKINYFAPIMMTKGFCDRRNNVGKGASIVYISSFATTTCDRGHVTYSGTKAALEASAKCISKEMAGNKVRVNCVCPSIIITPLTLKDDSYIDRQKHLYPFGFGEPNDVANLITYLLSDEAKFISGQSYVIDTSVRAIDN